MPTAAQVANRRQPAPGERHYPATVTAAGPPVVVALDPGGASTTATPLGGVAYTVGNRVLVLVTSFGNYVIGRIT
jgi:hypothetical protein